MWVYTTTTASQRLCRASRRGHCRLRHRGVLTSRLFADRLDRFGLERYSTEHWIGSHPNIKPCDMAPLPLHDWLKGIATEADYAWASGPRQVDPPADNPRLQSWNYCNRVTRLVGRNYFFCQDGYDCGIYCIKLRTSRTRGFGLGSPTDHTGKKTLTKNPSLDESQKKAFSKHRLRYFLLYH